MFSRTNKALPAKGIGTPDEFGCFIRLYKLAGLGIRLAGVGYCVLLAIYWLLATFVGERNPLLAFLLLMPPLLWGLPLAALFFPALLVARRTAAAIAATSAIHLVFFMGYECPPVRDLIPADQKRSLTLLSYNRGQHNNQSLQPFKNRITPDVIVLQDAKNRAANYRKAEAYAEFDHISERGEFVILSKFPVRPAGENPPAPAPGLPPSASRFEVDFNGIPIAVYAVHTMTPRDWVSSVKRGGFLYGILGIPGTPWAEKRRAYSEFWNSRMDEADQIVARAKSEQLPTVIIGDLNVADTGYIYRKFSRHFTDNHDSVGSGYGYTFPGKTRNPTALFQPWLRLDYAFSDSRWKPLRFVTEQDRPSQHRAIATTLELR